MAKLSLSVTNKIERKIRAAESFQFISSDKTEEIIDALKLMSIRTGLAIYIWTPAGLVNIKSRQTPLPATRSVLEALKYASKNHYFAVYVFPAANNIELLELKSTLPTANHLLKANKETRFLFLVESDVYFNFLYANGEEIELINRHTKKYKLRDSKWVLSNE